MNPLQFYSAPFEISLGAYVTIFDAMTSWASIDEVASFREISNRYCPEVTKILKMIQYPLTEKEIYNHIRFHMIVPNYTSVQVALSELVRQTKVQLFKYTNNGIRYYQLVDNVTKH